MITPAYAPTATERVLPRLALDFTTAIADPRVTTSRAANTATRFNASGLIEIVNANLPRFDFSPTAPVCRGQLIEEARTNLFLNSLIDGTNLATQSVTLSAVTYTLSFYGSGSVTISGGHSAIVAGIGDFPNRKTYSFTPTAGSSTFTVSGDVKFAQIEAGAFATSYIPTTTTSLTRNADVVSMTGTNFSSWANVNAGTLRAKFSNLIPSSVLKDVIAIGSDTDNYTNIRSTSSGIFSLTVIATVQKTGLRMTDAAISPGAICNGITAYSANRYAASANARTPSTNTTVGAVPLYNTLSIGSTMGALQWSGWMRNIDYWPLLLTDAEVQSFSK